MPQPRDIFLTGYPDFIARRLLEVIQSHEPEAIIRLLVHPSRISEAKNQLQDGDLDRDQIEILRGDISSLDFGLSGTEYLEILANVTDIYHLATAWHVESDRRDIKNVNIGGTRNVLDAAFEMDRLNRLNHLSSAFVAGDRAGVIMESELQEGQSFRNAFERTKYYAEVDVRNARDDLPVTVYRPSLMVGDSETGEINETAGPYKFISAIVQMPSSLPLLMPGKGDTPLNLVPIDYVAKALYKISLRKDAERMTFHLCDPNPVSARKVFELLADRAGKNPPLGYVPYGLTKLALKIPGLKNLARQAPKQFIDDFNHLAIFNSINTIKALGGDLRCPPFPDYVDKLVDRV